MALADAGTVRPDSFFKKEPLWLSRASHALIPLARDRVTGDTNYLQRFASAWGVRREGGRSSYKTLVRGCR